MEFLSNCLACQSSNHRPYIQTKAMMYNSGTTRFTFNRCENCGLVFLNPRVPENELSTYYPPTYLPYRVEEAWGKYASFVKKDQENIDKARVRRVKKHHRFTVSSRLLDIGCGKPSFLSALQKHTHAQLMGLDFSDEGWKNDNGLYSEIKLIKGEIADLKGEKPVDVVTMWHYLEHDYAPCDHLKQVLDLSHSETILIVEVPNFDSYTRRKFGDHWAGFHTPRHTALYSPKNIKKLMHNSGWEVEHLYTYGTLAPYTLHWMSQMEQKGIDWTSSMETRFVGFVKGMVMHAPIYLFQRCFSMGFMTVVAKPA